MKIRKVYVDSKYRLSPDTTTSSNFTVQLNETIECDDNTGLIIDDMCIPNTIGTVINDMNDVLYFIQADDNIGTNKTYHILSIDTKSFIQVLH